MAEEKNFENKVKRFLESRDCWYVKFFANRMTKAGVPDLLCCVNGYFVGVEIKASKGKPSPLQLWNRDLIRESGGVAIVLYPDRFEDFQALVDDLIQHPEAVTVEYQRGFD